MGFTLSSHFCGWTCPLDLEPLPLSLGDFSGRSKAPRSFMIQNGLLVVSKYNESCLPDLSLIHVTDLIISKDPP